LSARIAPIDRIHRSRSVAAGTVMSWANRLPVWLALDVPNVGSPTKDPAGSYVLDREHDPEPAWPFKRRSCEPRRRSCRQVTGDHRSAGLSYVKKVTLHSKASLGPLRAFPLRATGAASAWVGGGRWSPRRDSNPRPLPYQGRGLPGAARSSRFEFGWTVIMRKAVQRTVSYGQLVISPAGSSERQAASRSPSSSIGGDRQS
jgi:hypothetical protein